MKQPIPQNDCLEVKITRSAMEAELGDSYKRCWAIAFKNASEGMDFDQQIETLSAEFDLVKAQAHWFVSGANTILFRNEANENRQTNQTRKLSGEDSQRELADYPSRIQKRQQDEYVSQVEMMSFLEDIEEMSNDNDYSEFWEDLGHVKQKVLEQSCATDNEVLTVFRIRSAVEQAKEENERFFDAYPISTDAWENGYYDIAGELIY
jgi:hypothetical protein